MEKMALQLGGWAVQANVFMHQPILELTGSAAKQAQLGIGIEAAVANPAAEEEILTRDPVARNRGIRGESGTDLVS